MKGQLEWIRRKVQVRNFQEHVTEALRPPTTLSGHSDRPQTLETVNTHFESLLTLTTQQTRPQAQHQQSADPDRTPKHRINMKGEEGGVESVRL